MQDEASLYLGLELCPNGVYLFPIMAVQPPGTCIS